MVEKQKKMTWKEIKRTYPDEWIELVDFDEDENGYVVNGVVVCHNNNRKKFNEESRKQMDKNNYNTVAIRYTGEHAPLRVWETQG